MSIDSAGDDGHGLHEPQFVPQRPDAAEGDGYLIGVANDYAEMKSELVIADAQRLAGKARSHGSNCHSACTCRYMAAGRPRGELPFDFDSDPDFLGDYVK